MSEWLAQNWFQLLTAFGILISWAVHYGISTTKWNAMAENLAELESKVDSISRDIHQHRTDSEMHVTPTLRRLLDERHEYTRLELSETRKTVQRIESLLTARQ